MKTIAEWQEHVHRIAREHGWWPEIDDGREPSPTDINSRLMLIVSEVAEACEDLRDGSSLSEVRVRFGDKKPVGFAVELADVVIRVMDLAGALGIDLQRAIELKTEYNAKRPFRHGGKAL